MKRYIPLFEMKEDFDMEDIIYDYYSFIEVIEDDSLEEAIEEYPNVYKYMQAREIDSNSDDLDQEFKDAFGDDGFTFDDSISDIGAYLIERDSSYKDIDYEVMDSIIEESVFEVGWTLWYEKSNIEYRLDKIVIANEKEEKRRSKIIKNAYKYVKRELNDLEKKVFKHIDGKDYEEILFVDFNVKEYKDSYYITLSFDGDSTLKIRISDHTKLSGYYKNDLPDINCNIFYLAKEEDIADNDVEFGNRDYMELENYSMDDIEDKVFDFIEDNK